jgi:hypothetical protein
MWTCKPCLLSSLFTPPVDRLHGPKHNFEKEDLEGEYTENSWQDEQDGRTHDNNHEDESPTDHAEIQKHKKRPVDVHDRKMPVSDPQSDEEEEGNHLKGMGNHYDISYVRHGRKS